MKHGPMGELIIVTMAVYFEILIANISSLLLRPNYFVYTLDRGLLG